MRAVTAPLLSTVAKKFARLNVTPMTLTVTGWLFGVTSCILLGYRLWLAALGFWLMNRLLDGLDGALARCLVVSDLGGFVDIVADFSIYGGFLVALAFAVPGARVALVVLFFAYYVSGTALLALSSIEERRRHARLDNRTIRFRGGLAEGTETVLVYCAICLFPSFSVSIVWVFAVAVFITAAQRIVMGVQLLRPTSKDLCALPNQQDGGSEHENKTGSKAEPLQNDIPTGERTR